MAGLELPILLLLLVGMFWFMSRNAKKQRENIAQKQKSAAVPGTWVITIGGFLGKVVSVDGDVVTLESPSGVETIWSMQAIREAHEPNFGAIAENEDFDYDMDADTDVAPDTGGENEEGPADPQR